MKAQEWRFMDKAQWPAGEWASEPDKAQWTDEATGLPCLIVRNDTGGLCGYVGVSPGHPFFQKDYSAIYDYSPDADIDVHGGLTYADFCQEGARPGRPAEHTICHIPDAGEPDRVWWLGFDCGHCGDLMPKYSPSFSVPGYEEVYRNLAYVKAECASLAAQLAALATEPPTDHATDAVLFSTEVRGGRG